MVMQARGNNTVVDLGHHINLGLLGPLQAQLGPSLHFVRIIRSRFDTVRSFLFENKVPCGTHEGMFTLCPLKHPDIALPVSRLTWAKMSDAQRTLWFIDEVEARWQRLRRAHPAMPQLTVNWCTGEQLTEAWRAVAQFIGQGSLAPAPCKHRQHGASDISDAELARQDAEYRGMMAATPAWDFKTLQDVQRPNDCRDRAPQAGVAVGDGGGPSGGEPA